MSLLLFVAINYYDYLQSESEPRLLDAYYSFGFPFEFYVGGGFAGQTIPWSGLIGNVLVALTVSLFLGWAVAKLIGPKA